MKRKKANDKLVSEVVIVSFLISTIWCAYKPKRTTTATTTTTTTYIYISLKQNK